MKHHGNNEKKPGRRFIVGIVILILLLLPLGGAALLYHKVVTAPLALDDPQKLASVSPMTAEERFRFVASDETVRMKLDKADIWNIVLDYAGENFLDAINESISSYSLSVSGCGIQIAEDGMWLDAELYYKEIRLPITVPLTLKTDGQTLSVIPTGVNLGPVALPVEEHLTSLKMEYDLNFPIISEVTQVSLAKDAVLLTGVMDQEIREMVDADETLYQTALFCDSVQLATDLVLTEESYEFLLARLEQEPGIVEELYHQVFVLAGTEKAERYLNSRNMNRRILPEMNISTLTEEYDVIPDQNKKLFTQLRYFLTNVVNDYSDKEFKLSEGQFLKKDQPFQAVWYENEQCKDLFAQLNPETFFLILVDAQDAYRRNTSSFYRIADPDLAFTQEVDYNKTYVLGCVFQGVGDDHFLIYETEVKTGNTYSRSVSLYPLTQEDVDALQVPGKFGVWKTE